MAQPATNPKIEELRLRLKADPKNRIFYPLAEELRKIAQFAEAEQVLRAGLAHHPSYLSAWVSLGRVLRELKNNSGAVEALTKALQLDPSNVVAARLLADAYMSLGEKIEAIKKYKLVFALLPGDEELEAIITQLDLELNPPKVSAPAPAPAAPPEAASPFAAEESPFAPEESPFAPEPEVAAAQPPLAAAEPENPFAVESPIGDETAAMQRRRLEPRVESTPGVLAPTAEPAFVQATQPRVEQTAEPWAPAEAPVFGEAAEPASPEPQAEPSAARFEPARSEPTESPFEQPGLATSGFEAEVPAAAPIDVDAPFESPVPGVPLVEAVPAAAEQAPVPAAVDESDVFAPAAEPAFEGPEEEPFPQAEAAPATVQEDITHTLTMADLYARQGLVADARQIYENILQRDPANDAVRRKLGALTGPEETAEAAPKVPLQDERIGKLEGWLAKMGKREVGRV